MSLVNVNKVDPSTGTTLTLGTSGDTVSIPSGVTLSGAGTITASAANLAASGAGGVTGTLPIANGGTGAVTLAAAGLSNTPMWRGTSNANQTIAASTDTKLNYLTEVIDTDSAYATSRFTVPSGAAGKYMVGANVIWVNASWGNQQILKIYKNGSQFHAMYDMKELTDMGTQVFTVLDLSVSDYIEIYVYQPDGSHDTWSATYQFWGYKLLS